MMTKSERKKMRRRAKRLADKIDAHCKKYGESEALRGCDEKLQTALFALCVYEKFHAG